MAALETLLKDWQSHLLGLGLLIVILIFTVAASGGKKKPPQKKKVQAVIDRDDYKDIVLTAEEVATHNSEASAWIIVDDKVHDVTKYVKYHPGGRDMMLKHAGKEATKAFKGDQHPPSAADVLAEYYIGDLVRS